MPALPEVAPLLHQPMEEFRQTLETNLLGPFRVTQAFAPLLGADRARVGKPGRIVQISSVGGKSAFPFLGSYVASTFALEGMSESLRREHIALRNRRHYGRARHSENTQCSTRLSKWTSHPTWRRVRTDPESLRRILLNEGKKGCRHRASEETVYKAVTVRKPRVRYAVVPQKLKNWTLPRALPARTLDRMIGKQSGLLR